MKFCLAVISLLIFGSACATRIVRPVLINEETAKDYWVGQFADGYTIYILHLADEGRGAFTLWNEGYPAKKRVISLWTLSDHQLEFTFADHLPDRYDFRLSGELGGSRITLTIDGAQGWHQKIVMIRASRVVQRYAEAIEEMENTK